MPDMIPNPEGLCGNCRYPRTGRAFDAWHCPECGSDYREVGLITDAHPDSRPFSWCRLALKVVGFAMFALLAWFWAT